MKISIYYATVTGNAQDLAERAESALQSAGYEATARDMALESPDALCDEKLALFIVSTWGDGEPPDDAVDYVERLQSDDPLNLANLEFSVCALGDTSYEIFCGCGKTVDERLEFHGAKRLAPRADCDVDFDDSYEAWLNAVSQVLESRRSVV